MNFKAFRKLRKISWDLECHNWFGGYHRKKFKKFYLEFLLGQINVDIDLGGSLTFIVLIFTASNPLLFSLISSSIIPSINSSEFEINTSTRLPSGLRKATDSICSVKLGVNLLEICESMRTEPGGINRLEMKYICNYIYKNIFV